MDQPAENAPVQSAGLPGPLSLDQVAAVVWKTATESLAKSFLVIVLGSVAIGIAGGIWGAMAPSPPPGFGARPEAGKWLHDGWHAWAHALGAHRFAVVFGLVFIPTLWARLAPRSGTGAESKRMSHLRRVHQRLSAGWFDLIVRNAFGALISAIVVVWVQQFTFSNLLFHWAMGIVTSVIQNLAQHVLGAGLAGGLQAWFDWYNENQLQFTFWCFYLAAIGDDLGIPNLKTLGRWLARRIRNQINGGEAQKC